MREIKFKAWDFDSKTYYHDINVSFTTWGKTIIELDYGDPVLDYILPNTILSQYVGFKDKNGVEIYEGDVVLIPCDFLADLTKDHARSNTNNILAEVIIENPYGVLLKSEYFNDGITIFTLEDEFCDKEELEIIGNVHQNPELLELKHVPD